MKLSFLAFIALLYLASCITCTKPKNTDTEKTKLKI